MDYQKLDAALAAALSELDADHAPSLRISVRMTDAVAPDACEQLEALGVRSVRPGRRVFSAELTPDEIAQLAQDSRVQHVSLVRYLRPLSGHQTGN